MPASSSPINIVVADAGPLISLAAAGRLDLLGCFGHPVKVLDVVREECLRKTGAPGEAELAKWFGSNAPDFETINSPMLEPYQSAVAREVSGEEPHACEGLGDAAISWFIVKIPRLYGPHTTSLVLTEDATFGNVVLKRNVHVLSTRAFLATLENLGIIASARKVFADISTAGREVSRYQADRPALVGPKSTQKTGWVDAVRKVDGPGL